MGESWIVSNLNAALSTWNDKLAEIWSLLTESPQTFKGGQVWGVMTGIHSALQAIGYGLLVLFFAVGVMKTCDSFVEVKKPEHALKLFIRFALAKGAVTYGLELMLAVFSIVQGMVSTIITQSGSSGMSSVTLPQELIDAINNVGFWDSIPLWAVTLIGGLLITVLCSHCTDSPVHLCRGAHQQRRQKLHPQLRRCMFAGRGDCLVLHYFLRHFVQPARRGYRCICGDGGMDLRWGTGVQPAGAGGSN